MARNPKRSASFFKVVIGDFVNKLGIPPTFVKYILKGKVPSMFNLHSDSGSLWRVRVQVEQGKYFFTGGWSKFAKHHRLEIWDFLVFNLVDSSTFDVIIYDRTACEKNIALAAKRGRGRPPAVNTVNEEKPSKKSSSVSKNRRPVSRERNVRQEVEFVSEVALKHVSFTTVVKEYQKYYVFIPRRFARQAGLGKQKTTIIKGPRGDMWPMNTTGGIQCRFGGGWSHFVHEHGIVVGDTLQFQHFPNTGNVVHVQIVNKTDTSGKSTGPAAKRGRGRPRRQPPSEQCAPSSDDEIISEQASFSMVLKKYQEYNVAVPKGFVEETGLAEKTSMVFKDWEGRTWPINVLVDSKSHVRLGSGWSTFVKENELEAGDTLLFQHIPNTGNVINLKLISKAGDGTSRKRSKRGNVF
ncbi:hypothetical protein F3Y22_tig00110330pilonHSYRG00140 [Hibiscus syriacus]|uniref:TF-B3 domain-containing protein n=1 Tax=Hibiscus syriacus TaxID=106335 RepID=A0A6A3AXM1_HIBSY|nr:putative B3 domain-containing protein Os03g0621600 [Hibiscus syriacus]KAE8709544.1 hypothetical protein F3Y22_tig00110330pilonHSYRG00140 [Hibiscus syriacus]